MEYEWGRADRPAGLAAGLWLASRFLPAAGWAVAAKAGLWLLWPLLVWVCGVPSAEETGLPVRPASGQALARLRRGPIPADRPAPATVPSPIPAWFRPRNCRPRRRSS